MFSFLSKSTSTIGSLFHSPLRLAPDPFLFCLSQSLAAFDTHYYPLIKTDSIDPAQSFRLFLIKDLAAQARFYSSMLTYNHAQKGRLPQRTKQSYICRIVIVHTGPFVAYKENLDLFVVKWQLFMVSSSFLNLLNLKAYGYLNKHCQAAEIKYFT